MTRKYCATWFMIAVFFFLMGDWLGAIVVLGALMVMIMSATLDDSIEES